ncbi:MAG: hypothetical protein HY690_10970 [Chloroflexi bacterium]|nr:hypothetical protein [Chloroflexota bacterium]
MERSQRLEAVLERLERWAEVRIVAAVAEAAEGASAVALSRQVQLPEQQVAAVLEDLERRGLLRSVAGPGAAEPCYALADEIPLEALPRPAPPLAAPPVRAGLDPAPSAEGRDSRQVASDISALYRRLFQRQPSLSWLLRQRRRAMLLGEDFGALLARVQAAQPRGNPQAYLEGVLKRLERERG